MLTTNRVESFDSAMISRIHLSLGYSPPDVDTRRKLWLQLLHSIPSDEIELDLDDDVDGLAIANMNGRQIANTVNTAKTIARFEQKPLQLRHIHTVLDVCAAFDQKLKRPPTADPVRNSHKPFMISRKNSILNDDK
ncbi:uncharacterized protein TRUGW13939_04954 [Talaromyces rugulosus]|uniref:ATPase AAA-type core domain-containing protein n=1 Tax=Talaromyces rugulosus TaxID=121627 RepID=A0A7H8QUZ2_TALRU|nr:uncharacterized protein TRUGW13939_04954 [Talaromyces rugulosus]QKX57834.1 hypothetical protein TRUGW13939_04954 [Talaromyces rugulosus]